MVGGSIVGPLWFVPMIGLYFITAPLFLILSKLPYAIFSIITFSIVLLSLFTDRPFNQYNPFLSYIHFFGFYILGVYFSTFSQFRIKLLHNYKMVFFLLFFEWKTPAIRHPKCCGYSVTSWASRRSTSFLMVDIRFISVCQLVSHAKNVFFISSAGVPFARFIIRLSGLFAPGEG